MELVAQDHLTPTVTPMRCGPTRIHADPERREPLRQMNPCIVVDPPRLGGATSQIESLRRISMVPFWLPLAAIHADAGRTA